MKKDYVEKLIKNSTDRQLLEMIAMFIYKLAEYENIKIHKYMQKGDGQQ